MPPTKLESDERWELISVIAGLYDFTVDAGPRGRRELLMSADLGRFLLDIDLSGSPLIVLGDLIGKLTEFGYLPERPTYHALGALLAYVLRQPDLPPEKAAVLARLIVKYRLVLDPSYIADLRSRYAIAEPPAVSAPAAAAPPPVSVPPVDGAPSFEVSAGAAEALEQIIGSADNFLDIYLLMGAVYSAQAVCRIELGTPLGTGFLIGPDLLLTNHHVLKSKERAQEAVARFGYRKDANGVDLPGREFKLQPDFYYYSLPNELDYALVRLQEQPLKDVIAGPDLKNLSVWDLVLKGKHRGYLRLNSQFIKQSDRVNIIQHPLGNPLKVVMTQNRVVDDMTDTRVQYLADTDNGSSGSPVFNSSWEVVALHHSAGPYPATPPGAVPAKAQRPPTAINEGIPMRAILKDFQDKGLQEYLPRD